ncbi:MAG TPA: vitamin K epoxide reductase family protein [Terriglobales bacterium]|nr:vitamin K epoxide reductase family protein [Terriglobales bacterium]
MSARRIQLAIAVFAIAGAAVSSVSLYHHYGTSETAFCDFAVNFNCDIVNRSRYSAVLGIPVALIGVAGYLVLLALSTLYRSRPRTPAMLLGASTLGLGFALYLTYIEAFVLGVWCILCLSSLTAIVLITVLSSVLVAQSIRKL